MKRLKKTNKVKTLPTSSANLFRDASKEMGMQLEFKKASADISLKTVIGSDTPLLKKVAQKHPKSYITFLGSQPILTVVIDKGEED